MVTFWICFLLPIVFGFGTLGTFFYVEERELKRLYRQMAKNDLELERRMDPLYLEATKEVEEFLAHDPYKSC